MEPRMTSRNMQPWVNQVVVLRVRETMCGLANDTVDSKQTKRTLAILRPDTSCTEGARILDSMKVLSRTPAIIARKSSILNSLFPSRCVGVTLTLLAQLSGFCSDSERPEWHGRH